METEEEYLLLLAESHLNRAKDVKNKNSRLDYRMSCFAVVNYYNLLIFRVGEELNLNVKESFNLKRKIFVVSQELPELLAEYSNLFGMIDSLRHMLTHTDISVPDKQKLKMVTGRAREFKTYIETAVNKRKNAQRRKKSLLQDYKEKIEFIRLWLEYPDRKFEDSVAKQSEKIKDVFNRLKLFERISAERLDDSSIKSLLSLLDRTLKEAELIYETIHSYCPKCGGKIIATTEQATHYVGPYDDPEPDSYTVWRIAKCEKCGEVFEREHITTEHI